MARPLGSGNRNTHHLVCEECGERYTALHPSRRHCPRPCAVEGCSRLNASGGYCKTHRTVLLGSGHKHSQLSAKLAIVLDLYRRERGNRCDLCGLVFGDERPVWAVADHDHSHCDRGHGCIECIRGVIHFGCNAREGTLRRYARHDQHEDVAAYLAEPPFQRWRRANSHRLPSLHGRLIAA